MEAPKRRTSPSLVLALLAGLTAAGPSCGPPDGAGDRGEEYRSPDPDLEVVDAALTEPLAGGSSALYLLLRNRSREEVALVGIEGDGVDATLHRTRIRRGRQSVMESVGRFPVPGGGLLRLRPGGDHAMLQGPGLASASDSISLSLRFSDGQVLGIVAPVVSHAEVLDRFTGEER